LKFHTILTRIMLLGNSNLWLNLREIQINSVLLIGQLELFITKNRLYPVLFFNAIAFSYHQGKRTVNLIREFWDTLYKLCGRRGGFTNAS
jgi:hypothetical protein